MIGRWGEWSRQQQQCKKRLEIECGSPWNLLAMQYSRSQVQEEVKEGTGMLRRSKVTNDCMEDTNIVNMYCLKNFEWYSIKQMVFICIFINMNSIETESCKAFKEVLIPTSNCSWCTYEITDNPWPKKNISN